MTGLSYAAASKLTELLLGADILSLLNQRQRDRVFFHRRYTTIFEMQGAEPASLFDEAIRSEGV